MPGRFSSSQALSSGRSISRTESSRERACCVSELCASVLNAESTAALVERDNKSDCASRPFGNFGLSNPSPKPMSGAVRGAGEAMESVNSRISAAGPPDPFLDPPGTKSTGPGIASGSDGGGAAGFGAAPAAFGASGTRLLASSSAIIRRMEARISSIDGSCDFAGCVIRPSPPPASFSASTFARFVPNFGPFEGVSSFPWPPRPHSPPAFTYCSGGESSGTDRAIMSASYG
jgi:hypothetical protein